MALLILLLIIVIWIGGIYLLLEKKIFRHIRFYKTLSPNEKKKFHPFLREDVLKINKPILIFKGIFLIPIRVFSYFAILFGGFIIISILKKFFQVKNFRDEQPKHFRYYSRKVFQIMVKIKIFVWGYRINEKIIKKEDEKNKDNKNYIFISNHGNYLDYLSLFSIGGAKSALSDISFKTNYVLSFFTDLFQHIYVDRGIKNDSLNKKDTINELSQRVKDLKNNKNYDPLMIFPEGNVSRSDIILPFKKGPFVLDLPIKMAVVDYRKNEILPEFTLFDRAGSNLLILTNLINNVDLYNFEEVVYPSDFKNSEGEINWEKMANYCRDKMSDASGIKKYETEDIYLDLKEYLVFKRKRIKDLNL